MKNEKTERKLQYFANVVAHEVEAKKRHVKSAAAVKHNKYIEETLEAAARRVNVMMRAKQDEIKRDANRQIAKAKVHAMAGFVQTRKEQIDRLFVGVQGKLARFTQEAEYENYLINRIKQVQKSGLFSIIKLSPHDMRLESAIKTATGLAPEVGSHDYIGGFILLDANRRIQADYTFRTRLMQAKKEFCYDSES